MEIRSTADCRCGLVVRPVRRCSAVSSASTIRATDVLPLVPAMWIDGYAGCGEPSSSISAEMRAVLGSILVSGQRWSSRCSTWSNDAISSGVGVGLGPGSLRGRPAGR